ncbi:MAG: phospholipid/cholesterol/gamma-HCH transport system substrate-binding protein [Thermoleophilaceae bacterium]|jgi:phospholipid/cholesterol/gamma-HCH transport system substrate-binding protein|nr:phospholipid/cholesterol/gamma-HCH transport system substrate-binding protein [Thermoleophilaceae bacterium]
MARVRSGSARRRTRTLASGALAVAVIAVALLVLTGGNSREYRVMMENAGQLVPGDLVRIGGVQAGTVKGLDLTPDGQAVVTVAIGKSWGRLHAGTTVTVRASGIATVTGRYVDISPGPSFRPALADGAAIDVDHTRSIVDIDQLLNTFNPPTRKSLRKVLHGFATWYDGREAQANDSAQYFPAALQSTTHLFDELNRDSGTLQQFITQTGTALHALARRRATLTDLVSNTRATTRALGSDNRSLSAALVNLPPALRAGSNAFAAVRPAIPDLQSLVTAAQPASRKLTPFLRDLRPVVSRAVPAFRDFRVVFDRPGKSDDLLDALRTLPSLGAITDRAFPQAEKTLGQSEPVLSFIRPYAPDLIGFARSFGSAAATYDANGHYARTAPVFDAFSFSDDANGGALTPKPVADRGKSPYLTGGHLRRCPGTALPPLSDASAPFVDNGPLANPDCDPTQVIK